MGKRKAGMKAVQLVDMKEEWLGSWKVVLRDFQLAVKWEQLSAVGWVEPKEMKRVLSSVVMKAECWVFETANW